MSRARAGPWVPPSRLSHRSSPKRNSLVAPSTHTVRSHLGARVVVVGVSIAWPMLLQRRVPVWETCQHPKLGTESTSESHHSMLESPNVAAYSANSTPDEHHCRSARQLVARTRGASSVRGGPLSAVVPLSWPYAVCESSKAPTQEHKLHHPL